MEKMFNETIDSKEFLKRLDDIYNTFIQNDIFLPSLLNSTKNANSYFNQAIWKNVFISALNIIENINMDNVNSFSIDISLKNIIESLTIIEMSNKQGLSDIQKKIFKNSYVLLYSNSKYLPLLKKINISNSTKNKNDLYENLNEIFHCSLDKIEGKLNAPFIYLKKYYNENIKLDKIIDKYSVIGKNSSNFYSLFSYYSKPIYEINSVINSKNMEFRINTCKDILNLLYLILNENDILITSDGNSFKKFFLTSTVYDGYITEINDIADVLNRISIKVSRYNVDSDTYLLATLKQLSCLIKSMTINYALEHVENVIITYKLVMEIVVTYFNINNCDYNDIEYVKKCFSLSRKCQLDEIYKKFSNKGFITDDNAIAEIYNKHYKSKYKVANLSQFIENIKKKDLYFLSKDNNDIDTYIDKTLKITFNDERYDYGIMIYYLAKDMEHLSGYNFNKFNDLLKFAARKAMYFAYYYIEVFISCIESDFNFETRYLNLLEEKNIFEKYINKYN